MTYTHWLDIGITAICDIIKFSENERYIWSKKFRPIWHLLMKDYYVKGNWKDEMHPLIKILATSLEQFQSFIHVYWTVDNTPHYVLKLNGRKNWDLRLGLKCGDAITQQHKRGKFAWKNHICFFITPLIKSFKTTSTLETVWRDGTTSDTYISEAPRRKCV